MVTATVWQTPVLVVGAGTAGSVLALELAHHGVACMVIDRGGAAEPVGLAHLGGRSMELLRRLGLAAAVRRAGLDADAATDLVWRQRLDRPPVLIAQRPSVNQLRQLYATVNDGSAPAEHHQPIVEARLGQLLRGCLAASPLVDLREGWTATGVRVTPDGVAVTAADGSGEARHTIRARYVVGCDGAASTVRRCAGIELDALAGAHVRYRAIAFRSADLALHSRGPGLSTLVVGGATLLSRPQRHLWAAHLPLGAGELGEFLGSAVEVLGVQDWDDTLPVARLYRRGPVFLAGAAAHGFAPAGDTPDPGIGDAVNLGWKLAALHLGWGGPALLDSYEAERRPRALMDRELLARGLETRRRFGRLAAAGAPADYLAGFLRGEPALADDLGSGYCERYAASPVIRYERGHPPPPGPRITPSTWPGGRAPAVRLADGGQFFDRLGPQFTLVDLTGGGDGRALAAAARSRGLPVAHLPLDEPAVRACWGRRLVLVRPDQHVAWRDDAGLDDWDAVLDTVFGRQPD
ncbi:FAD-dependent oxidoreductase [Dactylosporangium vinaceum]|uniref:FAD-dependent monooxygenase n=1 Tax=Dactylosporangium vinaceum TaxID=53362 RepID=A0ABV5M1Z6_9ACTN|nr:FAD-dependent monooxygenase [Dactylosporangium vinaceum]